MQVRSLGQEDPLEDSMAIHSSILAWRIPWTEEPGGAPLHLSTFSPPVRDRRVYSPALFGRGSRAPQPAAFRPAGRPRGPGPGLDVPSRTARAICQLLGELCFPS